MSRKGYRTLVMGERVIPPAEYERWATAWNAAQTLTSGREVEVDKVAESIENNLELVGATGVEDKLQVGGRQA
jgi:magnesium-transporting ATPase (P-type)